MPGGLLVGCLDFNFWEACWPENLPVGAPGSSLLRPLSSGPESSISHLLTPMEQWISKESWWGLGSPLPGTSLGLICFRAVKSHGDCFGARLFDAGAPNSVGERWHPARLTAAEFSLPDNGLYVCNWKPCKDTQDLGDSLWQQVDLHPREWNPFYQFLEVGQIDDAMAEFRQVEESLHIALSSVPYVPPKAYIGRSRPSWFNFLRTLL